MGLFAADWIPRLWPVYCANRTLLEAKSETNTPFREAQTGLECCLSQYLAVIV